MVPMNPTRAALAGLALAVTTAAASAQTYPTKRINFVVGFAAGGFADTFGRAMSQKLKDSLGQTITVENRAGAGGNTAAASVAGADPDGYTVLVTTTALAINHTLYKKLDYKTEDLRAVAIPAGSPESIASHPSKGKSLKDFLEQAKGREITLGSAGVGTGSHLAAAYFFQEIAKVKANHVPFRGGAPAVQAAVGAQIDVVASSFGVIPQVQRGALTGLAVASAERLTVAPQLPTYAESGYPFEAASWVGFFVPAKTPDAVVARLNAALNAAIEDEATRKHLLGQGFQLTVRDPAASQAFVRSEIDKWGKMVKTLDVSVE